MEFIDAKENPICPYCETELKTIERERKSGYEVWHNFFICPHCKKLIGITSYKEYHPPPPRFAI